MPVKTLWLMGCWKVQHSVKSPAASSANCERGFSEMNITMAYKSTRSQHWCTFLWLSLVLISGIQKVMSSVSWEKVSWSHSLSTKKSSQIFYLFIVLAYTKILIIFNNHENLTHHGCVVFSDPGSHYTTIYRNRTSVEICVSIPFERSCHDSQLIRMFSSLLVKGE